MVSSEYWFGAKGFYNDVATQSLRFDDGSSAFLSRTPSSTTNEKTFTFSCWAKRATLGNSHSMFSFYNSSSDYGYMRFSADGTLRTSGLGGGSLVWSLISDALHRDTSAWYHIVFAFDTTQATSSDRIKMYVNGTQITSFSTTTYPSLNLNTGFNDTYEHRIGLRTTSSMQYDGYLSEVNFVDGSALDPTYFGETKNGVWIAKKYTGSYGTNGFRLQFNQTGTGTASASTIGADTSGNTHHFTSSGIVVSDCNMPDSPENNFPTMNPNNKDSASVLSEGNLKLSNSTAGTVGARNTMATPTSGKYYVEFAPTISGGNWPRAGIARTSVSGNALDGETWFDMQSGASNNRGSGGATTGAFSTGDVGAIAFDADAGKIYLAKNNTWQNSGDPVNGTGYMFDGLTDGPFLFSSHQYHTANVMIWNFGQDSSFAGTETAQGNTDANGIGDFYYAPPSGFLALCSSNLPEPTISPNETTQADDYFNTILWTGDGADDRSISGVGFQPDFVWLKQRNGTNYHTIFDSTRGATKAVYPNDVEDEATNSDTLQAFESDGFQVGTSGGVNGNTNTFVAWNWKANGGTTSTIAVDSVSSGVPSIASTVQANTTAGFSIVTYTGNQTNGATIGHGLNEIPQIIIHKNRSVDDDWSVYTETVGTGEKLLLNSNAIKASTSNHPTTPTNSVFYVGAGVEVNGNGNSMLAYCFHSVEGYSKFGSYTGNSSPDGTFVYTGFRPAFIMVKSITTTFNWVMFDNVRDPFNFLERRLHANDSIDEQESNLEDFDFLSNGFKPRRNAGDWNATGSTYIYMAFAETPTKYSLAR